MPQVQSPAAHLSRRGAAGLLHLHFWAMPRFSPTSLGLELPEVHLLEAYLSVSICFNELVSCGMLCSMWKTTCASWLWPSTMWTSGMELRSSVLVVITVTLWDILLAFIVFYKCFSDQYI